MSLIKIRSLPLISLVVCLTSWISPTADADYVPVPVITSRLLCLFELDPSRYVVYRQITSDKTSLRVHLTHLHGKVPKHPMQMIPQGQFKTIRQLTDEIVSLRSEIADHLRQLAEFWPDAHPLQQALRNTASTIGITSRRTERFKFENGDVQVSSANYTTAEVFPLVDHLVAPLAIMRGHLAELVVAQQVPDLVATNRRLGQILHGTMQKWPRRAQDEMNPLLDGELDLIFHNGRAWGEVKQYSFMVDENHFKLDYKVLAQAQKKVRAVRILAEQGIRVQLYYFFLGGITPGARKKLEDMGITVISGRHIHAMRL